MAASEFAKLAGKASIIQGLQSLADDWTPQNTWVVGTGVHYAVYVHEGTSRMEGRPYLSDAVRKVVTSKGNQLAAEAENADDLVAKIAFELEGETKNQITAYGAVDTGHLRRSVEARKI